MATVTQRIGILRNRRTTASLRWGLLPTLWTTIMWTRKMRYERMGTLWWRVSTTLTLLSCPHRTTRRSLTPPRIVRSHRDTRATTPATDTGSKLFLQVYYARLCLVLVEELIILCVLRSIVYSLYYALFGLFLFYQQNFTHLYLCRIFSQHLSASSLKAWVWFLGRG